MAGWRVLAVVVATTLAVSAMDATTLRASRVAPVGRADEHYRLSQPGPTDSAEVEKFLDELFASQLDEGHIAGAAVAVVKDGRILFSKGYGLADVENGVPVDPESTLFRIGSISKLFTWTAVMQLVEQGKLDLDADVNTYLDFRVPDTFSEPITPPASRTGCSGA
jgi:CubicO group peptidase (beta-lactamase class C family)